MNPNSVVASGVTIRTRQQSMTAAGERITRQSADDLKRILQPWQFRALDYYNMSGPAWYAAQFYSRMLSGLELYAAEKNDKGELVRSKNDVAIAELNRIQDPGGGRSGLLGAYGRLFFLNGEGRLLCTVDSETQLEQWEMLSVRELRIEGDRLLRYRAPSMNPQELRQADDGDWEELSDDNEAVVYRLHRRHPEFSAESDCPMRAVLDDFEELLLLTRAVRSRARSRLAGPGLLFFDEAVSPRPPEPKAGEDPAEDLLMKTIGDAMMAPLQNEGAASEVVPILLRLPVPDGKKLEEVVYHMQVIDPMQLYPETGLRMEVLQRIAIGLDMPPEVLTGIAQLNHWSGWLVDESTWKGHGEPVAQQLVDDLTSAFFRPTLKARGVENWWTYFVMYDDAGVVNHPDRSTDAKDLNKLGAIGWSALRDANNFTDKDKMSEEEQRIWLSIYSRDPEFAVTGISGRLTPAGGAAEGLTEGAVTPTGQTDVQGEQADAVVKDAPATPTGDARQNDQSAQPTQTASGNAPNVSLVVGVANAALIRARQAAGNRILSHAKRKPELRAELRGVRVADVASTLGRERVRALGCPDETMLVVSALDLIEETFLSWNIQQPELAAMIADQVEQHAARTLYEKKPVPIPASLVNYIAGITTGLKTTP